MEPLAPPAPRAPGTRGALVLAAVALTLTAAPAGASVRLRDDPGPAARVAVSPVGAAAVLYPTRGGIRVQRDAPERPGAPPVPRGSVVEGFAVGAEPAVLFRPGGRCSAAALALGGPDGWRTEALPDGTVSGAALAVAPDGTIAALVADCAGDLALLTRSGPGAWGREPLGLRAERGRALALAVGAGGRAVAAAAGRPALVALRDPAGGWAATPLPGGPLRRAEAVFSVAVGLDPSARPVALVVRGRLRPPAPGADRLGRPVRLVQVLDGGGWTRVGAGRPVSLASAGQVVGLMSDRGVLQVSGPQGPARVPVGRGAPHAVGADGTVAWIGRPRRGRPVLAVRPAA